MRRTLIAAIILTVEAQLVKLLLALNREFYSKFAEEFSETRPSGGINLTPVIPYLHHGAEVLEIGCGNGRLAERIDREGYHLDYLGLDVTSKLVEIARSRQIHFRNVAADFRVADVTAPGWSTFLQERAPFDLVLALAVLHHLPGFELRRALLRDLHARLRPGGVLLMSNWQFTRNERLRRKIVPWQTLGVEENGLEPGDALLDWKRGGKGYRYVHLLTEGEVESLAEQSNYQVVQQFYAEADLNLFSVLSREG